MLAHFVLESVRDFFGVTVPIRRVSERVKEDEVHLQAAVDWLLRSIDACGGRASSKAYRFGVGWMPPYRETTGYVIPTLLEVAERHKRPELKQIANRMGDWLAEVQEPSGGFTERDLRQGTTPIVFNTGQILHGFNALILREGRTDLIPSARRAGDFLVSCADESGCFIRSVGHDIVHAYNVRTAWALLTLGRLTGDRRYEDAALANADWTLSQQNAKGFFLNNTFKPGGNANTHGIAYVLQGLIEIHVISGEERYATAVHRSAERVVSVYGSRRRLAAEIGENWEFLSRHSCVTGNAQLALVLFRLYSLLGDMRHLNAALNLLDGVAATQNLRGRARPHYGGIKGSDPVYGRYAPLQYPNWAAKFFVDALFAKQGALNPGANRVPVQLSAG
jgi:hypothetical protein